MERPGEFVTLTSPWASMVGRRIGLRPRNLGSIRQRRPEVMTVQSIDFKKPIERDSILLLYRKRVLGRFDLDEWTLSAPSRLNVASEVQRLWVAF
jgi:hypothetical protein